MGDNSPFLIRLRCINYCCNITIDTYKQWMLTCKADVCKLFRMKGQYYDRRKLTEARELLGKSQQQIADELGVDRQTIYRAEAGTAVSYALLAKLCGYYRIPMTNIIRPFPELETA
jgi:DNA-binding XRE family transcriptional regulator